MDFGFTEEQLIMQQTMQEVLREGAELRICEMDG